MQRPVSFVSLGPGDPELITVKALNRLRQADVIIVPATAKSGDGETRGETSSRAADIIAHWQLDGKVQRYVIPMQHNLVKAWLEYEKMAARVLNLYQQEKNVVIAVEGDVSIYASIHYVLEMLSALYIPTEQLPGITSFIAAAASAQLSLIEHSQSLSVLPGRAEEEELMLLMETGHNVVVMKLSQCAQDIKAFIERHPDFSYHYFENVGTPEQFYTDSPQTILDRDIPYFSMLIIQH